MWLKFRPNGKSGGPGICDKHPASPVLLGRETSCGQKKEHSPHFSLIYNSAMIFILSAIEYVFHNAALGDRIYNWWCEYEINSVLSQFWVTRRLRKKVRNNLPEPEFVKVFRSLWIDFRPGGPVRQPYSTARQESIPGRRLLIWAQGISENQTYEFQLVL
jgi:hypothetical protein